MTAVSCESTYRAGSGAPMVLIHVGANPWHKWEQVLPLLTPGFDVLVPTLPGFDGGAPLPGRATVDLLTDAVEAAMDAAGFGTAHVVGNSLGGWIAMELARRGRATSAIALCPAGGWPSRWAKIRVKSFFRTNYVLTHMFRPLIPFSMRITPVRWLLLRKVVQHPQRVTPHRAAQIATDTMNGNLMRVLGVADGSVEPYPDPGIPTLIAWSERDRLTPLKHDGLVWRRAAPHAEWRVLPDAGHMPMYDDPQLTFETIAAFTANAHGPL